MPKASRGAKTFCARSATSCSSNRSITASRHRDPLICGWQTFSPLRTPGLTATVVPEKPDRATGSLEIRKHGRTLGFDWQLSGNRLTAPLFARTSSGKQTTSKAEVQATTLASSSIISGSYLSF